MAKTNWKEIRQRNGDFIGGQVKYVHLGDTYRGEVSEIRVADDFVIIPLLWVAIARDGGWCKHADNKFVEGLWDTPVEGLDDGGYRFTSFFRDSVLYPKGHASNIKQDSLTAYPPE